MRKCKEHVKCSILPGESWNFHPNQLVNTMRFERRWWVRAWRAVKAFFGYDYPGTYVVVSIDHEEGIVVLERL